MIRLLVADDHPVIRHGIRHILELEGDMTVAGEAADGLDLLERARAVEHDIVLLDLSMPHQDGIEVLKHLKAERPKTPVVILTMHAENQFAVRALKAGAAGYVVKDTVVTELVAAVRKCVGGGRYVSPVVAEGLAASLASDGDAPIHEQLSDREYQVLLMIASGKSTRKISEELSLSAKTIATYRGRIFEKMRVRSPAELAAYVVRNRLAD